MKLLYKYYSNESEYAFDNLDNSIICFSPVEVLNDPFEGVGTYLYQVCDEEQMYWESIGSDLPKLLSVKFSEDLRDLVNFKYRVFCSTREYNNSLLWAYYANSHQGFCVGYDESSILEVSDEMFDVEYSSKMCQINELDETTIKRLLAVKSIDWSKENECRALYELKADDVLQLDAKVYFDEKEHCDGKIYKLQGHVQTNDLRTLCSDRFICKKCKPVEIYLGMRMTWDDKQRLINIARKLNAKVYQMLQEHNSFGFISEEVTYYNQG